jgi:hypothetical protein
MCFGFALLQESGDSHDLGFDLVGGRENPLFRDDHSLFVSHVAKGGPADGKLRSVLFSGIFHRIEGRGVCFCKNLQTITER